MSRYKTFTAPGDLYPGDLNGIEDWLDGRIAPFETAGAANIPTVAQKAALAGTGTPGSANVFATRDTLAGAAAGSIYGDASDGSVTISSNTNLVRDMYYLNLTVAAGVSLNTAGYRVFVSGTLTNQGTIHNNGSSASGSVGGAGGLGGGWFGAGSSGGSGGGVGANGFLSTNVTNALGGTGGFGSAAGGGSAGIVGTNQFPSFGRPRAFPFVPLGGAFGGGTGGSGGGGSATAGFGGGGGGGGGALQIVTRTLNNTGTISANGGAGDGGTTSSAGNGGGGAGGAVHIVYGTLTALGTVTATGGAAGTGGTGTAGNGGAGTVVLLANL